MAGKTEGIEVFLCATRMESSVNLEELLRAIGYSLVLRKVSLALKPVCSLSRTVDADGTEIYSQTLVLTHKGICTCDKFSDFSSPSPCHTILFLLSAFW